MKTSAVKKRQSLGIAWLFLCRRSAARSALRKKCERLEMLCSSEEMMGGHTEMLGRATNELSRLEEMCSQLESANQELIYMIEVRMWCGVVNVE